MLSTQNMILICVSVGVIFLIAGIIFLRHPSTENLEIISQDNLDKELTTYSVVEASPDSFVAIMNLLPFDGIEVSLLDCSGKRRVLLEYVPPCSKQEISKVSIGDYGGKFIFCTNNNSSIKPLKYEIFAPVIYTCNVHNIYVGAVYTRNYIDQTETFPIMHDMPYLRIHNLLTQELTFNQGICVPARDSIRYIGREGTGVSRGFVMCNKEKIFEDVRLTQAVTDIYFGLITGEKPHLYQSDIVQIDGLPVWKLYLPTKWENYRCY